MENFILKVSCPSRRGIVAAISTYLAGKGCGIVDSSQFDDVETRKLFMRLNFWAETGKSIEEIATDFAPVAREWELDYEFFDRSEKTRILLMVSRFGHCLNDLLFRWKTGSLPVDIVGVVSNHFDFQELVLNYGLPFHHVNVTKENKPQAEAKLLDIVERSEADLIVLARYMQILSEDVCQRMSGRIINIHHSFLPSFKGALPYKQAHSRGVKMIGATAHYVTADLDEGPIIEQAITRVTHAQSPEDFIAIGRDVECITLSRAIHAHVDHRVFLNGNKTIVFPPSPGSYAMAINELN